MSTKPIPVIEPVDDFQLSELPIASVPLDGSDSTPSTGASSITGWLWSLHSKPPTSNASLLNNETATPQLIDVDQPGSYLISLQVTDNLGRTSHAGIEPLQSPTAPYGFSFPAISSMIAIRVRTQNGLVKAAYGERQWLEKGLWELVDGVDELFTKLDTVPTNGQIYADDIYEFSAGHGIVVHHDVVLEDADLTLTNGVISTPRVQALDNSANIRFGPSGGDLLCTANDDIVLAAGDNISLLASSGAIAVAASETVTVTGAGGVELTSATGDIAVTSTTKGVVVSAVEDISLTSQATVTLDAQTDVELVAVGDVKTLPTGNAVTTAGGAILMTAETGFGAYTDNGAVILFAGGNALNDTEDATATVTFDGINKRRVIDLDGFVSEQNHILTTTGNSTTVVIPNGVETLIPLRGGRTALYTYEALCGSGSLPNFALSFTASFNVADFTTQNHHYLTIYLNVKEVSAPSGLRLATFTFQPGGSVEVDNKACIVRGLITSYVKDLFVGGDATLTVNATHAIVTSAGTVTASTVLNPNGNINFYFTADSNDPDAAIANVNAAFSLMRSS